MHARDSVCRRGLIAHDELLKTRHRLGAKHVALTNSHGPVNYKLLTECPTSRAEPEQMPSRLVPDPGTPMCATGIARLKTHLIRSKLVKSAMPKAFTKCTTTRAKPEQMRSRVVPDPGTPMRATSIARLRTLLKQSKHSKSNSAQKLLYTAAYMRESACACLREILYPLWSDSPRWTTEKKKSIGTRH
jgi:hypothetical protein